LLTSKKRRKDVPENLIQNPAKNASPNFPHPRSPHAARHQFKIKGSPADSYLRVNGTARNSCIDPDAETAFASSLFDAQIRVVADRIREKQPETVLPLEYLHVIVQEIGNDEVNDLASLYQVFDTPNFQREQPIFENERLFLNYALAVAASYAVKRRLDFVLFSKIRHCP
jgi:hypothetical protein